MITFGLGVLTGIAIAGGYFLYAFMFSSMR